MNSSQYRKLPRHYTPHDTFHLDLTQPQALTLVHFLPKGCSLVQQSRSKMKQNLQKMKQQNSHFNQYSSVMQQSSSNRPHREIHHHVVPVKQQIVMPKPQPAKQVQQKKAPKEQIPEQVKPCLAILQQLKSYKHSWPFMQPVDAQALGIPEYYQIIAQPMDLTTAQKKMKSGQYKTPVEFYRDVNLMIKNSYIFNSANEEFIKLTNDFEKYFWRIAGAESKPANDKKLEREKERERERLEKERLKEEKIREKLMEKEKERERKLLLQQQQQAELALRLAKKKKKFIPKDMLQAQNITPQQKHQLASNIHCLAKQHLKGIRQIVFGDLKQEQNLNKNTNQFDIQKIGYKKIRQLQKYVRAKLGEMENTKFSDQMVEKKNQIDLDEVESEWTEEFVE